MLRAARAHLDLYVEMYLYFLTSTNCYLRARYMYRWDLKIDYYLLILLYDIIHLS